MSPSIERQLGKNEGGERICAGGGGESQCLFQSFLSRLSLLRTQAQDNFKYTPPPISFKTLFVNFLKTNKNVFNHYFKTMEDKKAIQLVHVECTTMWLEGKD